MKKGQKIKSRSLKDGKPKRKNKSGVGRPKLQLCEKDIEDLAAIGCITEEIARLLDCSKDTIENRYMDSLRLGRARLKKSLRRRQIESAMEGNATMLVWLGKNLLGQKEKQEIEHSGTIPLNVIHYGKNPPKKINNE